MSKCELRNYLIVDFPNEFSDIPQIVHIANRIISDDDIIAYSLEAQKMAIIASIAESLNKT